MTLERSHSCNGCVHNWYSARDGLKSDYPGRPAILSLPHSRCTALEVYVPMVMGEHDKWLASDVPKECPIYGSQDFRDAWEASRKSRDRAPDAPKRGRPRKPDALSPAERARRYRAARKAAAVTASGARP